MAVWRPPIWHPPHQPQRSRPAQADAQPGGTPSSSKTAGGGDLSGLVAADTPVDWSHPLSRGLVGFWLGIPNSGWHGGVTFRDLVRGARKSNDGRITGTLAWAACTNFSGPFFNGAARADCGDVGYVDGAAALTVTCRAKLSAATEFGGFVDKLNASNQGMFLILGGTGAGNSTGVFVGARNGSNSEDGYTAGSLLSLSRWYHLTYWFSGAGSGNSGRLKFYLDGVEQSLTYRGTVPATITANAQPLNFAGNGSSIPNATVTIESVLIHGRALTPYEIMAVNRQSTDGFPDLLHWIPDRLWYLARDSAAGEFDPSSGFPWPPPERPARRRAEVVAY